MLAGEHQPDVGVGVDFPAPRGGLVERNRNVHRPGQQNGEDRNQLSRAFRHCNSDIVAGLNPARD